MSIQVQDVAKVYGQQFALDHISFSVRPGEIVGFLGPNGAGKSTTMKILTGFLSATSGTALVDGMDVSAHSRTIRQITGYLPEHNPLYHDMYVHEYLTFVAGLYGMRGATVAHRVKEMAGRCGLSVEQNKKIGALSKGYRQRVGLAQALLHDPKVLILDEPTTGLDPNQLLEIRKLIRDMSHEKTVIFSTHIMQEVEALCDRVLVINRGKLVADDTLEGLRQRRNPSLVVAFGVDVEISSLITIPGILRAESMGENRYRLFTSAAGDARADVGAFAATHGIPLLELRQEEHSLESVFSQLTMPAAI